MLIFLLGETKSLSQALLASARCRPRCHPPLGCSGHKFYFIYLFFFEKVQEISHFSIDGAIIKLLGKD